MLPKPRSTVVFQRVPDGAVLLDTQTEVYFGLNPVGARVWEFLASSSGSIEQVCKLVLEDYPDADLETVRSDIGELLEELRGFGLLVSAGVSETAMAAE